MREWLSGLSAPYSEHELGAFIGFLFFLEGVLTAVVECHLEAEHRSLRVPVVIGNIERKRK